MLAHMQAVVFYIPFLLVSMCLCSVSAKFKKGKERFLQPLLFVSMMIWQICEIVCLLFAESDPTIVAAAFYVKHFFFALIPSLVLHNLITFYRMDRRVSAWIPAVVYLAPLAALFFSISSGISYARSAASVPILRPLFWASLLDSYLYVIYFICVGLILFSFRLLPNAHRRGSSIHIIGLVVVIFADVIKRVFSGLEAIDLVNRDFLALSILSFSVFFAALTRGGNQLKFGKKEIFDALDDAIFVLNEQGVIVDTNLTARKWINSLGRPVEHISFDGLLSVLVNTKHISRRKPDDITVAVDEETLCDIYFIKSAYPLIYRLCRQKVDNDDTSRFEYITISDITRNRLLIERLRDMAGSDALTGLANRYRYQELLRILDRRENYPLSIIIGDANGLKTINDKHGHAMGDAFLCAIGKALKDCCPARGHVARYGGDEFVTLLPCASEKDVDDYIYNVYETLKKVDDFPLKPSISLGFAIKHHENENLNALISQADKKMYDEKMIRKNKERQMLEATLYK